MDLDVRRRNFCFIALLGGVANTMQEAVSLAKHLAECEGCEPGDILCLLHTHFTDRETDTSASSRRSAHHLATMPFSRLRHACPEGALAGLVQCLRPQLAAWKDPQYQGYNKDYPDELPDVLQQDYIGQFHLDSQARALHTAFIRQMMSKRRAEMSEDEVRILESLANEKRLLAKLYPSQTVPCPPYSVADLLQYIRSYWVQLALVRKKRVRLQQITNISSTTTN